jgi:hypothetical protein
MNTEDITSQKLIPFLRNLAERLESKQLLPRQIQKVGEFFMAYQFNEQAIKDNTEDVEDAPPRPRSSSEPIDFTGDEMIKFLIMGWYCYCLIKEEKSIPKIE